MSDIQTGEDGAPDERKKRQRLLAAVLSTFPTKKIAAFVERSDRYHKLLAGRPEEKRRLAQLQGLVISRWGFALRRWRRLIDDYMRQRGQTQIRWYVLWELAVNPGVNLTSIATRIGVTSATLVGMVDEFEAEGLIERTVDENDRRSKLITLTPEGERTVSWMYDLSADLRWEFMKGLSEAELLLLVDAIEIMQTNLDRLNSER